MFLSIVYPNDPMVGLDSGKCNRGALLPINTAKRVVLTARNLLLTEKIVKIIEILCTCSKNADVRKRHVTYGNF